jgi:hypothetical protein
LELRKIEEERSRKEREEKEILRKIEEEKIKKEKDEKEKKEKEEILNEKKRKLETGLAFICGICENEGNIIENTEKKFKYCHLCNKERYKLKIRFIKTMRNIVKIEQEIRNGYYKIRLINSLQWYYRAKEIIDEYMNLRKDIKSINLMILDIEKKNWNIEKWEWNDLEYGSVLSVPFKEKDEAKKAGAIWSQELKAWRIPKDGIRNGLEKWLTKDHKKVLELYLKWEALKNIIR